MPTYSQVAGKKRKPHQKSEPFQMRLNALLRKQLDELAKRNASTLTMEVSIAIRTHLQVNGLWPPSGGKPADE